MQETVDLVEDIAVQFVTETVHAAMAAAAVRAVPGATGAAKQKSDVDVPDLLFAVRKDPRKVARVQVGRRLFLSLEFLFCRVTALMAAAVLCIARYVRAAKQKSDVHVPDLLFAVRKDPQKVARIHLCCEVLISDCPVNGSRWLFGCVLLCGSWCRQAEE
jgi:hypothetical protein